MLQQQTQKKEKSKRACTVEQKQQMKISKCMLPIPAGQFIHPAICMRAPLLHVQNE